MLTPRPIVGCTIEARCTHCRKNCSHTVLSLKDSHLERVQCTLCEAEHVYKPPTKKKTGPVVTDPGITEWKQLQSEFDLDRVQNYSMKAKYLPETVISHPTLGLGLVRKVTGQHMVEVLFESGTKLMRCNGGLK